MAGPIIFFLVPLAFGHPLIAGDGTDQNLPLRVLSGYDLSHGHLPLWNPYIWSGTPLLAGFNAGALYPGTMLFAFLPALMAWSLLCASVFIVAGLGVYWLLRSYGLRGISAMFGSITWICGGFFAAQVIHIDLVTGWCWIPWLLLCVKKIFEGHRRWTGIFGILLGLVILAGNPEAMVEGSMLVAVYCFISLARTRRVSSVIYVIAGSAIGFAMGAIQWLPGIHQALGSQRGTANFNYFVGGSLSPKFFVLLLDPFAFGGFGRFGVPDYFGSYSLIEVSSYVGIIGLGALFSLPFVRKVDSGSRHWAQWYLIGGIGLALAMGSYLPLAHLTYHIPLYRLLRLPSRNLAWVSLCISILVGYWVDRFFLTKEIDDLSTSRVIAPSRRVRISPYIASLIPVALVLAVSVAIWIVGYKFEGYLAGAPMKIIAQRITALRIYSIIQSLVALGFAWILLRHYRRSRKQVLQIIVVNTNDEYGNVTRENPSHLNKAWTQGLVQRLKQPVYWLAIFMVVDLGFYFASQRWIATEHSPLLVGNSSQEISLQRMINIDGGGRFAVYDPNRLHPDQLDALGQPDLNILDNVNSVEGYGSIVPGSYAQVTGTHQQLTLTRHAITDGTFSRLGLSTLLVPNQYFQQNIFLPGPTLAVIQQQLAFGLPTGVGSEIPPPGNEPSIQPARATLRTGSVSSWFIGQVGSIHLITVNLAPGSSFTGVDLQLGLLLPNNKVDWMKTNFGSYHSIRGKIDLSATMSRAWKSIPAIGIALRNLGSNSVTIDGLSYQNPRGARFIVQGMLTDTVTPQSWQYRGRIGDYQVYGSSDFYRLLTIKGQNSGSITDVTTSKWGSQSAIIKVSSTTKVVRSVAYAKGWRYTLSPFTDPPKVNKIAQKVSGQVSKFGIVQEISVPPGRWKVNFYYFPPSVIDGGLISLIGLIVAIVLVWFTKSSRRLTEVLRD